MYSGIYNYTATVNQGNIITMALKAIKVLDALEAATAEDNQDAVILLNLLVKQWMGKTDGSNGLKTWTQRRGTLFLQNTQNRYNLSATSPDNWTNSYFRMTTTSSYSSGTTNIVVNTTTGLDEYGSPYTVENNDYIGIVQNDGSIFWTTIANVAGNTIGLASPLPVGSDGGDYVYSYSAKAQYPLNVSRVFLRDRTNQDTPIGMINSDQYNELPNKNDPNNITDPQFVYIENQLLYSYVYLDCGNVYDVRKQLKFTYLEPVQDIVNLTDNLEYPQEWFLALVWGLAKQLQPFYPAAVWDVNMESNYQNAISIAKEKDPQTSAMYFQSGV